MSKPRLYVPGTTAIDITAPGGIEALLEFHRATFGDARMDAAAGETAPPAAAALVAGAPVQAAPAPQVAPVPAAPAPTAAEWDGKVESLPEGAQNLIRQLRSENAQRRTGAATAAEQAQQDAIRALAKAAGIELPDGAPTVETLTHELTTSRTETDTAKAESRTAQVELAVYRTASKHQGDPDALLDSRTFLTKIADLDPAAADFQAQVDAAIKDAVSTNPKLKTVQATGASGVDHAGGTGEGAITQEQFAAMSPAAKNQLYVSNPTLYRQLSGR